MKKVKVILEVADDFEIGNCKKCKHHIIDFALYSGSQTKCDLKKTQSDNCPMSFIEEEPENKSE